VFSIKADAKLVLLHTAKDAADLLRS